MKRSGSNPTAAAIGTLKILDRAGTVLTPTLAAETADFLSELNAPGGGYQANARAPLGDLLSTFTTSWTLIELAPANALTPRRCWSSRTASSSPRAVSAADSGTITPMSNTLSTDWGRWHSC